MSKLTNAEKIEIMRTIKSTCHTSDDKKEFLEWVALIENSDQTLAKEQKSPPRSE